MNYSIVSYFARLKLKEINAQVMQHVEFTQKFENFRLSDKKKACSLVLGKQVEVAIVVVVVWK